MHICKSNIMHALCVSNHYHCCDQPCYLRREATRFGSYSFAIFSEILIYYCTWAVGSGLGLLVVRGLMVQF